MLRTYRSENHEDLFSILALKIHISEATKDILESLGGFIIEARGEVFLKVCNSFVMRQ